MLFILDGQNASQFMIKQINFSSQKKLNFYHFSYLNKITYDSQTYHCIRSYTLDACVTVYTWVHLIRSSPVPIYNELFIYLGLILCI